MWDKRVKAFLQKTGEEFRRFSHDVQEDARRLLGEVRDPQRQKKLKEGLAEVGTWARRAAEEVATAMEDGVKKAEDALAKVAPLPSAEAKPPAPTAPSPPPQPDAAPAPPLAPPRKAPPHKAKSVGPAAHRKRSTAAKGKPKKTIGRRGKPGSADDE